MSRAPVLTATTRDPDLTMRQVVHSALSALGHLPLSQGYAYECARCGASGTASETDKRYSYPRGPLKVTVRGPIALRCGA